MASFINTEVLNLYMATWTGQLLGVFVKLWKAVISFLLSVCLSICLSAWNHLAPTGQVLMKLATWGFFKNLSKNSNWLKLHKNNRYFKWRAVHTYDSICLFTLVTVSVWILHRMRNLTDRIVEKNTFCVQWIFFPENCAVCEIMWKSMLERGRPQRATKCGAGTVWLSCGIAKATIGLTLVILKTYCCIIH